MMHHSGAFAPRECGVVSLVIAKNVGWAKAQLCRAHHRQQCSQWWARFLLRSLSYRGRVRFAHPTQSSRGSAV
jgi:hypothetical protein